MPVTRVPAYLLSVAALASILVLVARGLSIPITHLAPLYMFTPLFATLIAVRRWDPFWALVAGGARRPAWFAIAWLAPPLVAAGAVALSVALPDTSFSIGLEGLRRFGLTPPPPPSHGASFLASRVALGLVASFLPNALLALAEEIGWRGLLVQEWLPRWGFWRCALLVGVAWGLWHAPLVLAGHNYPQHPALGVAMMTVFCVLWSPLLLLLRVRTGAVLAPALCHGALNAFGGLSVALVSGGSDLTAGLLGLPGLAILAALNGGLAWQLCRTPEVGRPLEASRSET